MAPDGETHWHPQIGLALGGGVARGFAHIGVLRALERNNIVPDIVVGTSIGAVVGAAYLAGKLDVLEDWARSLNRFRILSYLDFRVNSGGLINGSRLVDTLDEHLGGLMIEELPRPFIAVATDLGSGHEVWLRKGPLVERLRASFSLPGIFPPTWCEHRWLIDGALVNPVPTSAALAMGAQMTIAVNLNSDIIGNARRPGQSIPTVAGFDLLEQQHEAATLASRIPLARRFFRRELSRQGEYRLKLPARHGVTAHVNVGSVFGQFHTVVAVPTFHELHGGRVKDLQRVHGSARWHQHSEKAAEIALKLHLISLTEVLNQIVQRPKILVVVDHQCASQSAARHQLQNRNSVDCVVTLGCAWVVMHLGKQVEL